MGKWPTVFCVLALASMLALAVPAPAFATEQKIENAKETINELEDKKQQEDEKVKELENTKANLDKKISEMDEKLGGISESLTKLEGEVAEKQSSIEQTKKRLKKAKKRAKTQYKSMKRRIQFLYEQGNDSLLAMLLSAESFSDFISRTEYVAEIAAYDREKLEEYQKICVDIAANQKQLEEEERQLAQLKDETQQQKEEMDGLIATAKEERSQSEAALGDAKERSAAYAAELEKQKTYEEQLEIQKAKEDAKRMEEIKRQEAEGADGSTVKAQAGDQELLAALIQCEAGGEPYEGKLAVGSVVLNRVASSYFPNSVVGVIYQGDQFAPVSSGRFATVLSHGADTSCTKAAKEVLGGRITIKALYFKPNNGILQGTIIGNHVFY